MSSLPIFPRSVFNLESHIALGCQVSLISFNLELSFCLPLFFITLTLTLSCTIHNTRNLLYPLHCDKHTSSVGFNIGSSFCLSLRLYSQRTVFKSSLSFFSFSSFSMIMLSMLFRLGSLVSIFIQFQGFLHHYWFNGDWTLHSCPGSMGFWT